MTTYTTDKVSGLPLIEKDVEANLDYPFKWTDWLAEISDTISTKLITAETGITADAGTIVGTTVVVWVSGGTVNKTYRVSCRITTVGGRIDERTILIKVKQR
jgi:hypothetical protein